MAKKKVKGEYNDFLDGEKLKDNAEPRSSLQHNKPLASEARDISPPSTARKEGSKGKSKGRAKNKNDTANARPTHFLCLPLVNQSSRTQLEKSLESFRKEMNDTGPVPPKAVRPLGTLHLTLGVTSLDEEGVEAWGKEMEGLDLRVLLTYAASKENGELAPSELTEAANSGPWTISLTALHPMQKPRQTSILYASPRDDTDRLYPFARALKKHFEEKGLMEKENRSLKLHATILNTIYAKPSGRERRAWKTREDSTSQNPKPVSEKGAQKPAAESSEPTTVPADPTTAEPSSIAEAQRAASGHGPNAKSWMRFDATEWIEKYKDFVWAQNVVIDRVHLCKMGAKKILNDEGEVLDERYEVVFERMI